MLNYAGKAGNGFIATLWLDAEMVTVRAAGDRLYIIHVWGGGTSRSCAS